MVKPDKSRYVYLYLPSAEEKAKWDKLAKGSIPRYLSVIKIFCEYLDWRKMNLLSHPRHAKG